MDDARAAVVGARSPDEGSRTLLSSASEISDDLRRHVPRLRTVLIAAVVVLALIWVAPTIAAAVRAIDLSSLEHPYRVIFGFVVFDAVIPIFPSESLLTTASNLAAQDDSNIEIWRLNVAGSLGAIVGDSLLYWLSRTVLRRSFGDKVDRAQESPKIARTMDGMSQSASVLIVFGRFVSRGSVHDRGHHGAHPVPVPQILAVGRHRWVLWDVTAPAPTG